MAKKDKEIEQAIELTQQEQDMQDLVGVLKSEMDDAKDFISQVGQERAESTEVTSQNLPQLYSLNLFQPMLEIQFYSCFHKSCVLSLVRKRLWSLYLKGLKILP